MAHNLAAIMSDACDLIVRTETASGAPTELSKIVNGHGDWMLYGQSDATGTTLESWQFIDLKAFRAALKRQ